MGGMVISCRVAGVLGCWGTGLLGYWVAGVLGCWGTGLLGWRDVGVFGYRGGSLLKRFRETLVFFQSDGDGCGGTAGECEITSLLYLFVFHLLQFTFLALCARAKIFIMPIQK